MCKDENKPMRTCSHCGESLESQFEICWNCGTSKDGDLDPEFELLREKDTEPDQIESAKSIYQYLGFGFLFWFILYVLGFAYSTEHGYSHKSESSSFICVFVVLMVLAFIVFLTMVIRLVIRKQDAPPSKYRLLSGLYLDEQIACPHCLTINHPLSYFCITCMTPLTSHAAIDPLYRIYAQGNTYQKAAAKPTNFLVVLGMWLLFGLQIPFMIWGFFASLSEADITQETYYIGHVPPLSATFPELLIKCLSLISVGAMIFLYTAIIVKVTRNYNRPKELKNDLI